MIGRSLGHYQVLEKLGEGGMGEVYLAEDTSLKRRVALKVLPPEMAENAERLDRFQREAHAVAALNHPNIVHIYSVENEDGIHFFTMELVEGESLDKAIPADGLPFDRFFEIALPLTSALAEAHTHGIVHRDLKPANVMVDRQGRPKILDFGLAKLVLVGDIPVATEAPTEAMTEPGVILGTYPYLSPEQARGDRVDSRSDLFSLGIMLYEMVTGQRPFAGDLPISLINAILNDDPPLLWEVRAGAPEALDRVLARCLEKDAESRISSAAELLRELEQLRQAVDSGVVAPVPGKVRLPDFLSQGDGEQPELPIFVGRREELARLARFLSAACKGEGGMVFITGEAGTGKTALARAFVHRAQEEHGNLMVASGGCAAHAGSGDAYAPIRQVLGQLTGDVESLVRGGVLSREQARRLWELLPTAVSSLVESAPDLVETLVAGEGLSRRAEAAAPRRAAWQRSLERLVDRKLALPPDVMLQQGAVFGQCARLLQDLAAESPLLLVLEDLHWSDTGSADLLCHLARQLGGHPILIVGSYRPSEVTTASGGGRHPLESTIHEVARGGGDRDVHLSQESDASFVDQLVDAEANDLGPEFRERLRAWTQGHALFTTELLRDMRQRGMLVRDDRDLWVEGSHLDWQALPLQVEGVIGERIGRLSDELRELLKVASVEGESFTAEVLARIQKADTSETVRLLSSELEKRQRLVTAEGLKRIDSQRLSLFRFLHVLFQKYLYDGLGEAERAYLHEDVGEVLEDLFGKQANEIAAQLARHFEEAGITEKAIQYRVTAGQKAVAMTAHQQAIGHYRRAIDLLAALPESPQRKETELGLQTAINVPLTMTAGWAAPGIGAATARALELAEQLGDNPKALTARWFLSSYFAATGDVSEAIGQAEQTIQIAKELGDELQAAMGHWMAGVYLSFGGRFTDGLEHVRKLETFCDRERPVGLAQVFGIDPGVAAKVHLGWILACLGCPEQGRAKYDAGIALAKEIDHPHSLCFAIGGAAISDWILEDWEALGNHSAESLEMALESGWVSIQVPGYGFRGLAHAQQGRADEGIGLIQKAIGLLQAGGSTLNLPMWLHCLALAHASRGDIQKAHEKLDEGIRIAESTGELMFRDILATAKGEIHAQFGEAEPAEQWLLRGMELAQASQIKFIELKAAVSLARLWKEQGRPEQARKLLAPVYDWFSEGLEVSKLREARTLLEELA